jgi:uncharacterized protein (TIGR02757 family)
MLPSFSQPEALKGFMDARVARYNRPEFIKDDPVQIPHRFTRKQDIEIMGFIAAILAWGQRKTIINKCGELIARMDGAPFEFIMGHQEPDLAQLVGFCHRTFNDTDLLYLVHFFRRHYSGSDTLEDAFFPNGPAGDTGEPVETALNHFRNYFSSLPDFPRRTLKHVSSPAQKSTCKRLNMFLRWMVRNDGRGVDFGIWKKLQISRLICPCDLHVERVARKLGLITRKQIDWQAALELTAHLRDLDPEDPVKYDFALFGLGVEEKFY